MSEREEVVLCGASAYNKKFYLNQDFKGLPDSIKDELKIMCVLFTEDIGGIFQVVFDEEAIWSFVLPVMRMIFYMMRSAVG